MSATVCGTKRSFYHDISSPPVSKRLRCTMSSTSPIRCLSPPSVLDQLCVMFPDTELQFLERTLEECGNDLDSAIKMLSDLRLASGENPYSAEELGTCATDGDAAAVSGNPPGADNIPTTGAEWVELLVKEMTSAVSMDDARGRASRILETLEKSITARHAGEDAAQTVHQENVMLKKQTEMLIRDNSLLKRAVALQHERLKDFEDKKMELEQLKQFLAQNEEQMRNLEINNYALRMHLKQAEQSSSMLGRYNNPDVF